MKDNTTYKIALEKERAKLEEELDRLGTRDHTQADNWDVKAPTIDIMNADENEAADRTEEVHIDSIVLDELEARYRSVLHALKKIEDGTYGTCEIGGEPIEEERLAANPAARTCKAHLGQEERVAL